MLLVSGTGDKDGIIQKYDTSCWDGMENQAVRNLPKALINWYDFEEGARMLFISGGDPECEILYEALTEKNVRISKADAEMLEKGLTDAKYHYIVAAGILERAEDPVSLLKRIRVLLEPCGKLLLGAENRLALRGFCGDKDIFSGHVFGGIDRHRLIDGMGRGAYAKSELICLLGRAGFSEYRFYSVMPCLSRPQLILAEDYLPNEPLEVRIFPQYQHPETVFMQEEKLYKPLIDNHMFHQMANAFLIECAMDGSISDIDQVTVQGDRSRGEAMATIIRRGNSVAKKALYPEGRCKLQRLMENDAYLRHHGIPVIDAHIENDAYVMPYIHAQIATEYFCELLRNSREAFVKALGRFQELICRSSEHVPYTEVDWERFDPEWQKRKKDDPNIDRWRKLAFGTEEEKRDIGVILERGYIDMVSLNCFYADQDFLFFDQEFYVEAFPANAVFIRTIDFIYRDAPDMETLYPKDELLKQFHLYEHRSTWRSYADIFMIRLKNEKELSVYHRLHRRHWKTVRENRYRMDYSQEEYDRFFTNIFKVIGGRRIYLFGAGNYAEDFIRRFGRDLKIDAILDNDADRQGMELHGIKIEPPSLLEGMDEPCKVFICIKRYAEVLAQLQKMGVQNISVYDPRLDYEMPERRRMDRETALGEASSPKKYHIGYVAGVFDLFHIGHLNLLRRAKAECDHLIVGVVTDEQVIENKKTKPCIPFAERMAIVQACRYVDEAVAIPADDPGTEAAYYKYRFDAQFSGSDYADNPYWISKKVFLEQHGSELVFFPYTENVSSTEIKERIEERDR